jgi:hypothetical protein
VRDWLKEERRRIVAQAQWSFVVAMLATILAGIATYAVAPQLAAQAKALGSDPGMGADAV